MASPMIVSQHGQRRHEIISCSPRAAPVLTGGGAVSSGERRATTSGSGLSCPALSKYRRASAGVHRSISSVILRWSVPAQPCFKLARALLVTYGEEGILAVQECGRRRRDGALRVARSGKSSGRSLVLFVAAPNQLC